MKSIVVYKIVILTGALMLCGALMAQKPAIDLISSHQQYRHPEAIIDTGYAVNPPLREAVIMKYPQLPEEYPEAERRKKKRRQIGPSLDSIFQKEEDEAHEREDSTTKVTLVKGRFIPMSIMIFIMAIK